MDFFETQFLNPEKPKPRKSEKEEPRSKEYWEDLLWKKAEELGRAKEGLEINKSVLYEEAQNMKLRRLNLHEQDIVALKEKEYWDTEESIIEIKLQEKEIEIELENIQERKINEEKLKQILGELSEAQKEKISKRKSAIAREKERLGIDPRQNDDPGFIPGKQLGREVQRITSGHNLKGIKYVDTQNAESAFIEATSGTHGGKMHISKFGNSYIGPNGKKIRKR